MFWNLVLPLRITFWTLIALVVVSTAIAPLLNWKRAKTFLITSALALVAFIPSCTGIMYLIDNAQFGYFEYNTFGDVKDFRVERLLPTTASQIKMYKRSNGYRAKYVISEVDLHAFLDNLWKQYGKNSPVQRSTLFGEGATVSSEELHRMFSELGWPPLTDAIEYHSPAEADGGGATYYFDASVGIVYQRTGYW